MQALTKAWNRPWEELLHAGGSGAREIALLLGRTRARLTLKGLGSLSGGLHHNAVSIAVRRFSLRLQKDGPLQRRLALVEKELSRIFGPIETDHPFRSEVSHFRFTFQAVRIERTRSIGR